MRRLSFIVLISVLAVVPVFSEQSLTLSAAIDTALTQNRDLAKRAAAHETALLDRAGAETDFSIRARPNGGVSSTGGIETRQLGLDLVKKSWPAR